MVSLLLREEFEMITTLQLFFWKVFVAATAPGYALFPSCMTPN